MITRRHILLGGLGAAATALVTTPSTAAALAATTATRCIVLYMHGGASQFETFDPKPGTREGGPTKAIATAIDGLQFSVHLPGLARRADMLAVLRSVTMREGNHDRARYLMRTGHTPQGGVVHPGLAAMVDARHGDADFVGAVAIGAPTQSPGLLGPRHAALTVRTASQALRGLESGNDDRARDTRRAALFDQLQGHFADGRTRAPIDGHTETFGRARVVMRSPKRAAFDLSAESAATRARYGNDEFGAGCLLARRLVDHEVAFVEVGLNGWDTHEDNFTRTTELATQLDRGMSALLDDLTSSGHIDDTLVVCMGDFGRSPTINGREGRDHFPDIASVVLAGGGITGGTVVGTTSPDGREIAARPIAVADLYRTICTRLGIDPDQVRLAASGRPITTVDGGKVIDEVV